MNCKSFRKKFYLVSFILIVGFFTLSISAQKNSQKKSSAKIPPCHPDERNGFGYSDGDKGYPFGVNLSDESKTKIPDSKNVPIRFVRKPIGKYTEEARKNCIEGVVLLKVTFLATGKIGKIKVLEGLDYGLSEQAVKAAKLMKFKPEIKNGKPKSVTKEVKYTFTIY